ncbi:MAG: SUMF1/EgtB/PvdO family nonheme iron enzyme [Ideonella sp.]|nr:SUMF1/EgtB/PvdO family nonheme iron enzyme [Ideonella sp.]
MPDQPTPPTLRIFLASPKDTATLRALARQVLEELRDSALSQGRFQLEILAWDDPKKPVPCSFLRNPQWAVMDYTGDPAECDLVIGLFRHQFGSPLPIDDKPGALGFNTSPDGDAWTGTEWELHRAECAARESGTLDILVFRDTADLVLPHGMNRADRQEANAQFDRVEDFFAQCKRLNNTIERGLNTFTGDAEFEPLFKKTVEAWIAFWLKKPPEHRPQAAARTPAPLTPAQTALQAQLLADPTQAHAAQMQAARCDPKVSLPAYLLHRWAEWNGDDAQGLDTRFVNLHLRTDHGAGAETLRFTESDKPFDDLATLLAAHPAQRAWVLLGEPGGGKSTLLQHHEQRCALQALQALAHGEPPPEVCIYLRLSDWRPADAPDPAAWLAQQWAQRYPQLPALAAWQAQHRVRWLLDGLNEIKAGSPSAWAQAVQALAQWAAAWAERGGLAPLFSVRHLDYSETLSTEALTVQQVRVALWQPEQVRQYVQQRLGNAAPALLAQLKADGGLMDLCRLPMNLDAQCTLVQAGFAPVLTAASLFAGLLWLRLERGMKRGELNADGLLSARDKLNINNREHWRAHWHHLPQEGLLLRTLQNQALAMHQQADGAEVSLPEAEVARSLSEPLRRHWLAAVQALKLAEVDGLGQFRFSHQRWQEALAARELARMGAAACGPLLAQRGQAQALAPEAELCASLGLHDPLPLPPHTVWEQTLGLLVQQAQEMGQDLAPWLAPLLPRHPALVARMVATLPTLPAGLAQSLPVTLAATSRNPAAHLCRRIEAALALGRHPELAHPAYERVQRPGHAACLLPTASHWHTVAAGPYTLGDDHSPEADERPAIAFALKEPLAMAWAPVTNAEFDYFIQAGGYADERWWAPQGATALAWCKGELVDQSNIDFWSERITALRADFDAAVKRYFPNATRAELDAKGSLRRYARWTAAETDEKLLAQFGAQRKTLPSFWDDPAFNHPLQPVVGVSVFEAQAYLLWLSVASGRPLRLPTEAEWECAARGPLAQPWPWGLDAPTDHRYNGYESHLRRSSPVGVFPLSDRPARALGAAPLVDLTGNVWEWCASAYTPQPSALTLHRAVGSDEAASALRAVRGGAWNGTSQRCRAGYRGRNHPTDRGNDLGFRVVSCPIEF